jgi:predicted nucleotidyltransferase
MDRHEIIQSIHRHSAELERFDVRALALYGPAARDMLSAKSDIDVLVEFEHAPTFESYMGLKRFLERLFAQRVDLSTPDSLEPDFYQDVMNGVIHVVGDVGERGDAAQRASGTSPPKALRESVLETLDEHRDELAALGARSMSLFGSVARGEVGPHSDVDLLVDLAPGTSLFGLVGLKHRLEDLLHRPVDVIPRDSLREHLRENVSAEAVEVWTDLSAVAATYANGSGA